MKPPILLDLDGVLSRTSEAALRHCWSRGLLLDRTVQDITHYSWSQAFPGEITTQQIVDLWSPQLLLDSAPCGYMAEVRRYLDYSEFTDQRIVTARRNEPATRGVTFEWLWRHGIRASTVEFVSSGDKAGYAQANGVIAAFEDHPETALELARAGIQTFLVAYSYNRSVPEHPLLTRAEPQEMLAAVIGWRREQYDGEFSAWRRRNSSPGAATPACQEVC